MAESGNLPWRFLSSFMSLFLSRFFRPQAVPEVHLLSQSLFFYATPQPSPLIDHPYSLFPLKAVKKSVAIEYVIARLQGIQPEHDGFLWGHILAQDDPFLRTCKSEIVPRVICTRQADENVLKKDLTRPTNVLNSSIPHCSSSVKRVSFYKRDTL